MGLTDNMQTLNDQLTAIAAATTSAGFLKRNNTTGAYSYTQPGSGLTSALDPVSITIEPTTITSSMPAPVTIAGTTAALTTLTCSSPGAADYAIADPVSITATTGALTTLTCSSPSTPDYAIADPVTISCYGFTTSDEFLSTIKAIANAQTRLGEVAGTGGQAFASRDEFLSLVKALANIQTRFAELEAKLIKGFASSDVYYNLMSIVRNLQARVSELETALQ